MAKPKPNRSRFKAGDQIWFTWAGPHYGKKGFVEHIRKDGNLVIHLDTDPPGAIRVVQPFEIDQVT